MVADQEPRLCQRDRRAEDLNLLPSATSTFEFDSRLSAFKPKLAVSSANIFTTTNGISRQLYLGCVARDPRMTKIGPDGGLVSRISAQQVFAHVVVFGSVRCYTMGTSNHARPSTRCRRNPTTAVSIARLHALKEIR